MCAPCSWSILLAYSLAKVCTADAFSVALLMGCLSSVQAPLSVHVISWTAPPPVGPPSASEIQKTAPSWPLRHACTCNLQVLIWFDIQPRLTLNCHPFWEPVQKTPQWRAVLRIFRGRESGLRSFARDRWCRCAEEFRMAQLAIFTGPGVIRVRASSWSTLSPSARCHSLSGP